MAALTIFNSAEHLFAVVEGLHEAVDTSGTSISHENWKLAAELQPSSIISLLANIAKYRQDATLISTLVMELGLRALEPVIGVIENVPDRDNGRP